MESKNDYFLAVYSKFALEVTIRCFVTYELCEKIRPIEVG